VISANLQPNYDFCVGIDSDGCVFDSMEVKQKEYFIPNALKYFNLYEISDIVRETWEFVNLYSIFRGGNRFNSLIKVFELLSQREELKNSGYRLPDMNPVKEWIKGETEIGNASLRRYFELHHNSDLENTLLWSEAVNKEIGESLRKIPPFPSALDAIKEISGFADIIIVSQTPIEALQREWNENDLSKYVSAMAGLEHGTKTEQIMKAAKGKYDDKRVLMIGDAIGDLEAAKNNGIQFFPVLPRRENVSWKRLVNEGLQRFRSGSYTGKYEKELLAEFEKILPVKAHWEK
jgi:phosphoglycolate phosphatase-like HAD superfamily hydrolase